MVAAQPRWDMGMDWSGIAAIDKPQGITSRAALDRVAKIVRPKKAGHAGTLDPLATGVLVVCVGGATRLVSHVQQGRKRYLGRFQLGVRSDTDDSEGRIEPGGDWSGVTESQLRELLPEFVGVIQQRPPQYSAVHVDGQRAHKLARRGVAVEISERPVEIVSLELTDFDPPYFDLAIVCGSGTYVRSIGRDLGERLHCGAIMTALRRTAVGPFDEASAIPFDQLNADTLRQALQPPLVAVSELPRQELTASEMVDIRQGKTIPSRLSSLLKSDPAGLAPVETCLVATQSQQVSEVAQRHTSHQDKPGGEFHQEDNAGNALEVALTDSVGQLVAVARLQPDTGRLQPFLVLPAESTGTI